MTEDLLAGQIAYYRARAAEYDATAYGDTDLAVPRIARLVTEMRPQGHVLEIACGTGLWTAALATRATSLTAIDTAPETIAIARQRSPETAVTFEVADVFDYHPGTRFDVVFFSAWLSHVPDDRFDEFWNSLRTLLTDGGRVLFIDEHVDEQPKESYVDDGIVERTLNDGTTFRIVKHFIDPAALTARLSRLGWRCTVHRDGTDWIRGEAVPEGDQP